MNRKREGGGSSFLVIRRKEESGWFYVGEKEEGWGFSVFRKGGEETPSSKEEKNRLQEKETTRYQKKRETRRPEKAPLSNGSLGKPAAKNNGEKEKKGKGLVVIQKKGGRQLHSS